MIEIKDMIKKMTRKNRKVIYKKVINMKREKNITIQRKIIKEKRMTTLMILMKRICMINMKIMITGIITTMRNITLKKVNTQNNLNLNAIIDKKKKVLRLNMSLKIVKNQLKMTIMTMMKI